MKSKIQNLQFKRGFLHFYRRLTCSSAVYAVLTAAAAFVLTTEQPQAQAEIHRAPDVLLSLSAAELQQQQRRNAAADQACPAGHVAQWISAQVINCLKETTP